MRDSQPSLTALLVAAARALPGPLPAFDPDLGSQLGGATGSVLNLLATTKAGKLLARSAGFALIEHIHLRTAAIDRAVQAAVAAGVRQVVVLGAGYDRRAWRLQALQACRVFEVDHPATQQAKQRSLDTVSAQALQVEFVPVDFAVDNLDERLTAHGHDCATPTLWLWEGVTMYLPPAALAATLTTVARRSALHSQLALTYMTPQVLPGGRIARSIAHRAFVAVGEPLLGAMGRQQMQHLLQSHGFAQQSDTNNEQWASEHGGSALKALIFRCERLTIAQRFAA
ncbi:MAG: SAM-dependent methyltransferase [Myxococcales bacterium]|nr:SAM-dependent methyltransferase [Myxococcales bacterium]